MASAGYSGTPLPKKLGIKVEQRVLLFQSPRGFLHTLGELPTGVELKRDLRGKRAFDVILGFFERSTDLEDRFDQLAGRLQEDGGLWIAWPKKASGVATDLSVVWSGPAVWPRAWSTTRSVRSTRHGRACAS